MLRVVVHSGVGHFGVCGAVFPSAHVLRDAAWLWLSPGEIACGIYGALRAVGFVGEHSFRAFSCLAMSVFVTKYS